MCKPFGCSMGNNRKAKTCLQNHKALLQSHDEEMCAREQENKNQNDERASLNVVSMQCFARQILDPSRYKI